MPHASNWTYFPSDCIKFHLIYFSCFGVMLRTSFKKFNQQRAITQKILKVELRFCALHFNSMSSTTELRFIKFPLVIIRTKIKSSHLQRAIAQNVLPVQQVSLYNAHCHCINFHSISFSCFGVVLWTRNWGQTRQASLITICLLLKA